MAGLHKFLFSELAVRGSLVRLTAPWQEVLRRRAGNSQNGAYPQPVVQLLGEMTAAAVLMHASIQFDGTLVMQILGDGPVQLAVAEVQRDLGLRATATLAPDLGGASDAAALVNAHGHGRCAITLDGREGPPYQGVVPLTDESGAPLAGVGPMLEYYMRQSEQLETAVVLAADDHAAAGLMLQRMPREHDAEVTRARAADPDGFNRLCVLARSLKPEELLHLDSDDLLHRLFWNEDLQQFAADPDALVPHFSCSCSRARMAAMLRQMGREEADGIVREQGRIEVGCEYCGRQEHFDAVDVAHLFAEPAERQPARASVQ